MLMKGVGGAKEHTTPDSRPRKLEPTDTFLPLYEVFI